MARRIALELDGIAAEAILHEQQAPLTTDRIWSALPIDETMRHVRWSGSAGYILCESLRDPGFGLENRVSIYAPGTINFRPEHGEFAISYGPAQARDGAGMAWATHVATLDGDARAFLDAVARTQHEGKKRLRIRRSE